MKKPLIFVMIAALLLFGLAACGNGNDNSTDEFSADEFGADEFGEDEGVIMDDEYSEVTIYANGGTIYVDAEEPYEMDLSVFTADPGAILGEALGETFAAVEMENAVFGGWTVYAVSDGEWVTDEVTDLSDGQLCVACGDYGYYLMNEYEVIQESASTEDMLACTADGRDYYILAIWN